MRRVMPLGDDLVTWGDRAKLMGVLNVTPDLLSDGGALRVARVDGLDGDLDGDLDRAPHRVDLARVVHAARRLVDAGAEFIDVGGQSTRPGATLVSAEEETARTIPAIAALTGAFAGEPADRRPRVSVDTFYGSVAAAAVAAGADVINDVSAGTMDPGMFAAVAATPRPVPYVAMHMRGDPGSMQSERHTTYAGGDVAGVAGEELAAHVAAATRAGVEPWRLWTDPGLGFAKTHEGCWDLLENLPGMRASMARRGAGGAAGGADARRRVEKGFPGRRDGTREGGGQRRGDGGGVRGGDVGRRGRPARARRGGGEGRRQGGGRRRRRGEAEKKTKRHRRRAPVGRTRRVRRRTETNGDERRRTETNGDERRRTETNGDEHRVETFRVGSSSSHLAFARFAAPLASKVVPTMRRN